MKQSYFLFVILLGCAEKKSEKIIEDSKYNFPVDFIKPQNNVSTVISENEEKLFESLTKFEMTDQFDNCANEDATECKGFTTVKKKIFVNITNEKKDISFLQDYEYNCQCNEANSLVSIFETIPIDRISSIDTISVIADKNNEILTSLIISPKFNSEVVSVKKIEKYFDKKQNKYFYSTDKSMTKNPIIFYTKKNLAITLKNKLENLIQETK
ncbi:hypothetical protein [Soonwooa purpurea]